MLSRRTIPSRLGLVPFLLSSLLVPLFLHAEPQYGPLYPKEKIETLRRNVEKYDWARKMRDAAVKAAAKWVALDDETLWNLIPGQDLPRCIDVTWDYNHPEKQRLGCLVCGDKIFKFGNYPYHPDILNRPWKLVCPSCGAVFPTNDFGKYYKSCIDEHGLFNPAKGDRSLLFNTAHPDPKDPLHLFGVDDGFGYIDNNGRAHKFIGYYTWKLWRAIADAHRALSTAYLYTGDKIYARKAAILLDRIADVYPSMDWKPYADRGWYHSDGGTHKGKIEGAIWECFVLRNMVDSYDKILSGIDDNPDLYAFLRKQAKRYKLPSPKGTPALFVKNIRENILRCGARAIEDGRIHGNLGMHQLAMADCAVAFNANPETEQWLDWIFAAAGGALSEGLVDRLDRDGVGDEGSPAYSLALWGSNLTALAELLRDYKGYSKHDLFRDYPNFVRTFTAGSRIAVLNWTTPNIGDTGSTGRIGKLYCDPAMMAKGFEYTGDPDIAVAAWRANGNTAKGLGRDIFDPDPGAFEARIETAAVKAAHTADTGHNMAGYGLASLEFGSGATGKALWMYYGRDAGHGHLDRLNFGLYAFGVDLAPDLGYPEFATNWPKRNHWTRNTISHNTVVVDGQPQQENWTGFPVLFHQFPDFAAMEVESRTVYPQTSEYARTMIFVHTPGGDAYAIDLFRVAGGHDHLLSFHGPPGSVAADGLKLIPQKTGTYAGESVDFGKVSRSVPSGYSWLHNVERDTAPPATFTLDWTARPGYRGVTKDDHLHVRLHVLARCSDVALADGDPPDNKPGNPRSIRYALLHRTGKQLHSTFLSVVEPYRDTPFIRSVRRLETKPADTGAVALRIELTDGTVDYVLDSKTREPFEIEGGLKFDGACGFLRLVNRKPVRARLIEGVRLSYPGVDFDADPAVYTGHIVKMNRANTADGRLWVDTPLPAGDALAGDWIYIQNDRQRNAAYEIRRVDKDGDLYRIQCGPVTFVRGYKDPHDYSKGYVYNFQEGAGFSIPTHASWDAVN